jgi:hypothetical protein
MMDSDTDRNGQTQIKTSIAVAQYAGHRPKIQCEFQGLRPSSPQGPHRAAPP